MSLLGFSAVGRFAVGQVPPFTGTIALVSVTFAGTAAFSGMPTSNYKQILATDNKRKLIYAAEISPWTLSQ